jgi:NAD(P)-dependent dehydrogenase (short-subunit alcohol dehydrogenase family)
MKIIVITGASSGFRALTALTARALAKAGHTVYASMRDTTGPIYTLTPDEARRSFGSVTTRTVSK